MGQVINLARWQFAITTIYHFFFVPLTIGLSFFIAIMESFYVKTKNQKYRQMIDFWSKLFLINFAMGLVTGLVQEFQFGMNWSDYSKFVGDIFGVPLAIEALLAFFLESTFLGIWIFGWDKVSEKIHLLSIWIVSIGTTLSAFFILTANSFMQDPTGYVLKDGRVELTSFSKLITNPHLWLQFPHTFFASLCTGAFFIIGISAWHLLKKNNGEWIKTSLKLGIIAALISTVLVIAMGDAQGKFLVKQAPMKMAAAEALWKSEDPASLSLFAVIDQKDGKNLVNISIPRMLSFMSYSSFTGKVEGINDIQAQYVKQYGPGNYIPPVALSFYTFRIMVGAGVLMLLLALAAIYYNKKKKLDNKKLLLKFLVLSMALPYIANTTGWILTEVGRSPWIVFGLLKINQAVSPTVSEGYVLTSLIVLGLVYTVLIVVDVWLMAKFARKVPSTNKNKDSLMEGKEGSLWI